MRETDNQERIPMHMKPDHESEPEQAGNTTIGSVVEDSAKKVDGIRVTEVSAGEAFDYVVPERPYKHRHHHHRRHHSHHSSDKHQTRTASAEEIAKAEEGYIFASKKKKRRKKFKHLALWKRILIITGIVLLALIVALSGTFLVLHQIGKHHMLTYGDAQVAVPEKDESGREIVMEDDRGQFITYDGKKYALNKNLMSIVFIGVDDGTGENDGLRMSDAVYILTVDTESGNVKILGVSRDTMVDVDNYSTQGQFISTREQQLAYAYSYANDKVSGGTNTNKSLQRLFYGLPFDNFFAIDLDALITLNDTIGGVTLTSSITFTSPVDGRVISEGESVTLHGKEAERYIRTRDTSQLDSNNSRMQRQQQYIRAFLSSVIPAVKSDLSTVTRLYDEIRAHSDTTLDVSKMTYVASTAITKMRSASDIEYVNLKGKIVEGDYAEMRPTDEETIRTMLDVFYTPID